MELLLRPFSSSLLMFDISKSFRELFAYTIVLALSPPLVELSSLLINAFLYILLQRMPCNLNFIVILSSVFSDILKLCLSCIS